MSARTDPVVLVEGGDPTLVAHAVSDLVTALVGDEDRALAVEDYAGEDLALAAVADACATPPFLVGRRVIVVRDVGRYTTEDVAPLLAYLEHPLETTSLVLVAGGGTTPAKLVQAAKAAGRVLATAVDGRQAPDWIRGQLVTAGLHLDRGAEERLRDHVGEDLSRVVSMVPVLLAAYGTGSRLGVEELEPYLGSAGGVTPWALTDAIDAGEGETALDLLHRLMEAGARHPLVVLAIVHRHVASLLAVDGPAIRTEAEAAAAMGIAKGRSTFPAKKALRSARQWGSANIAEAVGMVADAEVDLKGRSAWPPEAVLEVLIARLCRLARPRAVSGRPVSATAASASSVNTSSGRP